MFSAFHYFAADKLIDRDVLLLPPPLVTCLKYIASAAVHPTTLDTIFNFPQRTHSQRIDIVLRSIFYFDSFPDELRSVIDPSLNPNYIIDLQLVPGHCVSDVHQLRPGDDVCLQEVTQRALLVEGCNKP